MALNNIVVGLDVGTTKISTVVAEVSDDGDINIIGLGLVPSRGLRKGVVINIEATTQSIAQSVAEAEKMADVVIDYVYVGVAGSHISSFNSKGVVAIGGDDREISEADVVRAIEAAKAVSVPPNNKIIHIIPRYYSIDNQTGIRDPKGMSGVRLEANVHIVQGAMTSVQNLVKSCHRAHMDVASVVLEPIASALAVLNEDERELGACCIDIGGGTANLSIFHSGCVVHSAVIPVGGNAITNDIAVGLRTTTQKAEELKIKHGCAKADLVDEEQTMEVLNTGGEAFRTVKKKALCDIIEPRMEETLLLLKEEITRSGCDSRLAAGIVLTGGCSQLRGTLELAEEIFDMPVRLGKPIGLKGLAEKVSNPIFATSIGLIRYGIDTQEQQGGVMQGDSIWDIVLDKIRSWFGDGF